MLRSRTAGGGICPTVEVEKATEVKEGSIYMLALSAPF